MTDSRSNSSSSRQENVEIETKKPFRSVRDAVSMFGGVNGRKSVGESKISFSSVRNATSIFGVANGRKTEVNDRKAEVDGRKHKFSEKSLAREEEPQHAGEELAKAKDQLTNSEKDKAKALCELAQTTELLVEMKKRLEDANTFKEKAKNGTEVLPFCTQEDSISHARTQGKHAAFEVELKEIKEQYSKTTAELEIATQGLDNMKQEFIASVNEKQSAVRLAEEALASAEINAMRVKKLTAEISETKESLENVTKELAAAKEFQLKSATTADKLEIALIELATTKEAEKRNAREAAEAIANLNHVKSELERVRMSEVSAISSMASLSSELQQAKANLKKALEDSASQRTAMASLQLESELIKNELEDLRKNEADANAAAAALTVELRRTKAELTATVTAEAKANEVIAGLSEALQNVTNEAEAAQTIAQNKLQDALQEASAAKAAEVIVLRQVKELSDRVTAARASELEASALFQEKYDALLRKMHEAEELASKQVAAALGSKQEMEKKLEIASNDIEELNAVINQVLQRAETAEVAKSAVETELKRLREKEHRREREALTTAQQPLIWNDHTDGNSNGHPFSFETGQKLETANGDMENMKKVAKQGPHRDEIAEAAKCAAEVQLKRSREERRRREKEAALAAAHHQPHIGKADNENDDRSFSFQTPHFGDSFSFPTPQADSFAFHTTPVEPLGKVLNIDAVGTAANAKIPAPEPVPKAIEKALPQRKKNNMLPFGGYLAKKRVP